MCICFLSDDLACDRALYWTIQFQIYNPFCVRMHMRYCIWHICILNPYKTCARVLKACRAHSFCGGPRVSEPRERCRKSFGRSRRHGGLYVVICVVFRVLCHPYPLLTYALFEHVNKPAEHSNNRAYCFQVDEENYIIVIDTKCTRVRRQWANTG